jgi:hypothetical protein
MANNFFNAIKRNISADSTLPTALYTVPSEKKAILIELDVANTSSAGQTVTVQIEDESQNVTGGNTRNVNAVATNTTGTLTTVTAHGMIVNDRVRFTNGTDPSFTNASLPPSGDAALSESRIYYVQSVGSTTTFTIAESASAASALTFDSNGASVVFETIYLADIVRDAPVPVGGALKVIAGQKLVIESLTANVQDKLYLYVSAANTCDAIGSVLQEVS